MSFIRLLLTIINWLVIIGITVLGAYIVASNFSLFGGYQSLLVQSGSMEPSIMTGDIIVIQSQPDYQINDVVTFKNNSNLVVTHRIIEIQNNEEKRYMTKGDANRSEDEDVISKSQIIGKVVFVAPKLGYFVSFTKTLPGLIMLVLIPAIIYILDELLKIRR